MRKKYNRNSKTIKTEEKFMQEIKLYQLKYSLDYMQVLLTVNLFTLITTESNL